MHYVLLLSLLINALLADPYEANPFYVDTGTVNKANSKWTFNLKNHHTSMPSSFNATNQEVSYAGVVVESLDADVLHVKIYDYNNQRWEVPSLSSQTPRFSPASISNMGFTYQNDPFAFTITDPSSGKVSFSTTVGGSLKFCDKYLEFGVNMPAEYLFGLGEQFGEFILSQQRTISFYTFFNRDSASPKSNGELGSNTYGTHPFVMFMYNNYDFGGMFFRTSNAFDVALVRTGSDLKSTSLFWKPIGGIFDLYFFGRKKSPDDVIKKYHELIGRPVLPPYWALGFHECNWGWESLNVVKSVVDGFDNADIPLEVMWQDIDYMKDYEDFTVDDNKYAGISEYVNNLHNKNMRFVPIIDAGLKASTSSKYYNKGVSDGSLIKSAKTNSPLIGEVWPGKAAFPDFFHPKALELWHLGLGDLYAKAKFDGIWIDMNEVSSFCNAECPTSMAENSFVNDLFEPGYGTKYYDSANHDSNEFNNLPYNVGGSTPLYTSTISLTGYHYSSNDFEDRTRKEYNTHNLFAYMEAIATHKYFKDVLKTRPFVLTRSSFAGSGEYTTRWLGDNFASWDNMLYSLAGMMAFSIFGIPLVGADICGFNNAQTDYELCARWYQLGAFYPFSRNHHNSANYGPWIPIYNMPSYTQTAARNSLRQKYSISRYYYTKLYEASINGGPVTRPLFYDFPTDLTALSKTPYMFMIGKELLVMPVLYKSNLLIYPYFPNYNWYDLRTKAKLVSYNPSSSSGSTLVLDAPYEYTNVAIRGGSVIPYQDAAYYKVKRLTELDSKPMEIYIALDHNSAASGSLIVDDGTSLNPIENKNYRQYAFKYESKKLTVSTANNNYSKVFGYEEVSKIVIMGMNARYDGCLTTSDSKNYKLTAVFDSDKNVLTYAMGTNGIYWNNVAYVTVDKSC